MLPLSRVAVPAEEILAKARAIEPVGLPEVRMKHPLEAKHEMA